MAQVIIEANASSHLEDLSVNSVGKVATPTKTYEKVGNSWCRPQCYGAYKSTAHRVCQLNGFHKPGDVIKDRCEEVCEETASCVGYASATKAGYDYGCYIYTNDFDCSDRPGGLWQCDKYLHTEITQTKSNSGGEANIECYKVTSPVAETDPAPTCEDEFPDCPVYAAPGGWCDLYQHNCQKTCGLCPGGNGPPQNLPFTDYPDGVTWKDVCRPSSSEHLGDSSDECTDGCNCWFVDCEQDSESMKHKAEEMCPKKCGMCTIADQESDDTEAESGGGGDAKNKRKELLKQIKKNQKKIKQFQDEIDEWREKMAELAE